MERIKRQLDDPIQDYNNNKKTKLLNETGIFNSKKSYLEDLANETIYEIFEYIDVYHVYHGFFYLSQRFKNLLLNSNFPLQINVSTISKTNFELYHQNLILPNKHRINILHLSNPFTVDIVFSPSRLICQFIQLERLKLENIHAKYLNNILKHLIFSPKFHSLILSPIDFIEDPTSLFLHLFRLPKLKFLQITYRIKTNQQVLPIRFNQSESSSIEYLIINSSCRFESLNSLLICLPKLRHLSIDYLTGSDYSPIGLCPILLTHLKYVSLNLDSICFDQFEELIKNCFCDIEILQISISNDQSYLHAQHWEDVISSSMPNLRIFDIKHDGSINSHAFFLFFLMDRFNSPFWQGKQWFFTNKYYWKDKSNIVIFHSINPYRRKDYQFSWQLNQRYWSNIQEENFNSVKHLEIDGQRATNYCEYSFPNVIELTIKNYFKTLDDSIARTINRILPLKQLKKLIIQSLDFPIVQFVKLISFTPNLHTLEVHSLSMYQTNSILIQQSEIFRSVKTTNKIQKLVYHASYGVGIIQVIGSLCPQLEYLQTGIYRKQFREIIRYLLSEMDQLFFLCMTQIAKTCLRELEILIQSENLLNDYFVKFVNRDLYLWW